MRSHLVITRGAAFGILISWVALIAAVVWIFQLSISVHDQQQRSTALAIQNRRLVAQDQHTLTLVCKLVTGFALNQPNLDPQFLRILNEIVGELPQKCFPNP